MRFFILTLAILSMASAIHAVSPPGPDNSAHPESALASGSQDDRSTILNAVKQAFGPDAVKCLSGSLGGADADAGGTGGGLGGDADSQVGAGGGTGGGTGGGLGGGLRRSPDGSAGSTFGL